MALKYYNHIDMQEVLEFQNAGFEKVAADKTPSADNEGNEYIAPGSVAASGGANRKKIVLNGAVEEYAFLTDVEKRQRIVGNIDASTGDLSAVTFTTDAAEGVADTLSTMDRGDMLIVTVDGDLVGVGSTETFAEVGDMLIATVDGPATLADFIIMQTNIDLRTLAQAYYETGTVAGSGPWTVTVDAASLVSTPGMTNIDSYDVKVDGKVVYMEADTTEDANGITQIVFTSDYDISGATVTISGMAHAVV